jgi:hypothetical protein
MANEKRVEIEEDISRIPITTSRFEAKRYGVRYRGKALNSISWKDGTWRTRGPLYILSGTSFDKRADKYVDYCYRRFTDTYGDSSVYVFIDPFVNGSAGEHSGRTYSSFDYYHAESYTETRFGNRSKPVTLDIPPNTPSECANILPLYRQYSQHWQKWQKSCTGHQNYLDP